MMQTDLNFSLNDIAVKKINNFRGRPAIIFLHDSLGCIELWRDFPEKLGSLTKCNVLIYDRQGYGKSCGFSYPERDKYYLEYEADILDKLLDFWRVEEVVLFGHSDGGSIALITAGKYPSKIKGIITEGAHVFVEDKAVKGIEEAVRIYETNDLKSKLEKYHGDKTEEMFWAWADTWRADEFRDWSIEKYLPLIKCPSLIIQGEDDEYGTAAQVDRIVNKTKGPSQKLMIPGAGHSPHKESTEVVLREAAGFIKQVEGN